MTTRTIKFALLGLLALSSGAQLRADHQVERHWQSGCGSGNWVYRSVTVHITVNYTSMTGNLHIWNAANGELIPVTGVSGTGSFDGGTYVHNGTSGLPSDIATNETDQAAAHAFVEGGPMVPVSGGSMITQITHHSDTCNDSSATDTYEVVYNVNNLPAQATVTVTYSGPALMYGTGVEFLANPSQPSFVAEFPIPGGGSASTLLSVVSGASWTAKLQPSAMFAYTSDTPVEPVNFTLSPSSGTFGTSGNQTVTIVVTGTRASATPTPAPTASPSSTVRPSPTPTPTIPPGATPSPTPTATPQGTPVWQHPSPSPGTSPDNKMPDVSKVIPGASPGGQVIVQNPNDFYDPVRKAMEDALSATMGKPGFWTGATGGAPGLPNQDTGGRPGGNGNGDGTGLTADRGHVDDLQGQAQQLSDKAELLRDKWQDMTNPLLTKGIEIPSTFGNVTQICYGGGLNSLTHVRPTGAQVTFPDCVQLAPYGDAISIMRLVLLWLCRIYMVLRTIKLFNFQM